MDSHREILNKQGDRDFSDYVYVCASTLNQMVNYIPIVNFPFKEHYTVTLLQADGEKVSENKKWDAALEKALKSPKSAPEKGSDRAINLVEIKLNQGDYLDISKSVKALSDKLKGKKVFWNLTGGQRPFLFAVMEYIKQKNDDYIAYLEGNTGKISLRKSDNLGEEDKPPTYHLPCQTTIDDALALMGFQSKAGSSAKAPGPEFDASWSEFYGLYTKCEDLRKCLAKLNQSKKDAETVDDGKEAAWKEVYALLGKKNAGIDCENILKPFQTSGTLFPFAYILEEMVFRKLRHDLKNDIQEIRHSTRLYETESDGTQRDEFDILILSKKGTIISIECKSGMMDGDVAKSTKYSCYAIAGVYGAPILVTPLLTLEVNGIENCPNKNIRIAVSSARRAGLQVWGIDKIVDETKRKLNL